MTGTKTQKDEVMEMDGPLHPDLVKWWVHFLARHPCSVDDLFSSPLHPLQRKNEMAWMLAQAKEHSACRTSMEIGADKGGGVYAWLMAFKPTIELMIVSEIRGVPYAKLLVDCFPAVEFLALEDSSYDPFTVTTVKGWLGSTKIDVLFLDGDKSYFDRDFDCYLPMMADRSVVFFHDIQDEAPRTSYDAVCKRGYRHEEHIDVREAVEMNNPGCEPRNAYEHWLKHWNGRSCGVGAVYLGS